MKLILVEDNPVTAMSLHLFFTDNNYEVMDELVHAQDIVKSIDKHKPDILVMDIMLKGDESSLDVAEELRHLKIGIPIMFVSALTDDDTISRIEQIANCDYIMKPYDYEKLSEAMEALVTQQSPD